MNDFEPCERKSDWHAVISIQLGELIEDEFFDWESDEWFWNEDYSGVAYVSQNRYTCIMRKFVNRFFYREISVVPPGAWRLKYFQSFHEIMPKYKPVYKALDEGQDIFQEADEYGKSRDIYSDFPETMLGDNQDYASSGNDRQFENIKQGSWIDNMQRLKDYDDADLALLKELEARLFSPLYTVNLNLY